MEATSQGIADLSEKISHKPERTRSFVEQGTESPSGVRHYTTDIRIGPKENKSSRA
jgi:hypothetical protein